MKVNEKEYMELALEEARLALDAGDYPVGAVLTVNNSVLGAGRNELFSGGRTVNHAEHSIISQNSAKLREIVRDQPDAEICLYTTLEPCLMCLGIAVMHRIPRIVVSCPDPIGGTLGIDPDQLGPLYKNWWPDFEIGLLKEESCDLIISFLKNEKLSSWERMLQEFQTLKDSW